MDAWQPLSSSNLDAMRYDPEGQTLQIRFKSGRTYSYQGVEASVAEGLANAGSPGAYFNNTIKGSYAES